MTFLEEVKEELLNLKVKNTCCMASEIRGMLTFGGACFGEDMIFGTDSFLLAKRLSSYLRRVCNVDFAQKLSEDALSYKFLIPKDVLSEMGLEAGDTVCEKADMENKPCCIRAFIRGAFLASGSASNPEKAYRVEIFSENEDASDKIYEIFLQLGINAKKAKRKNHFVVYGNNSESASDILKAAEATGAVFKMLEAKVKKEKRNDVNRQMNFDMANIERVNENSRREADAIRLIAKKTGLEALKPKLRQAAILRLENEGASLKELCELSDEQIPKSTLKNRLNRLIKIAEELSDK